LDWTVRYIRQRNTGPAALAAGGENQQAGEPDTRDWACFSLENLPLDDQATYALMRQGNAVGIFQFESRGMKDLLQKAKPDRFEDLIALVALYRPGPMALIPEFVERKHGKRVEYMDPRLRPILEPTYGVMIYQEQVMQIAQVIGGYSLGSADLLRRAMGKKKAEEMAQQRDIFVAGAVKNGLSRDDAAELFNLMEKFAGYGFNKSHAAAYALIAFQTAYLKAHYPSEFMAATLSADMDDTDKVHAFFEDSLANGLIILPPDINLSGYRFLPIDEKTIRYGLGAVKGTGESAIAAILQARERGGPYTDLFDFCLRVDKRILNRRVVESLIRAGAFDSLNPHRAGLLASVGIALEAAEQVARAANQVSLFDSGGGGSSAEQLSLINVPAWAEKEKLKNEKLALGFYLSGHPFTAHAGELKNFVRTRLDRLNPQREPQLLAGIVYSIRTQMTRRGRMGVIVLDDGSARIEVVAYSELFESARNWVKEDQLLLVEAKVSNRIGDDESGELRISAERLYDFDTARSRYAKNIKLYCNGSSSGARLKEILAPYLRNSSTRRAVPGGHGNAIEQYCPVWVVYRNRHALCELELGEAWRVSLEESLIQSLEAHFNAGNVEIMY
ncbi:MAG TPA: DNA polymerase III subunit alpha, partial [Nitrosospira sp.]|nr:DNA polymerase III subunit alpha [Nitrosospira sp.]